ncbi:MAG: hypothetical protein DRP95_03125 [Candidatus Latescibacterota bacterium]|nr:MAG: hypothetical protein DRP95_03125 [Candidatus Latescibacterota bacterium]
MQALLLALSFWTGAFGVQRIAVLPFEDRTGFEGPWNIRVEIPRLLGERLGENPNYSVMPMDTVVAVLQKRAARYPRDTLMAIGRELDVDYLIVGTIEKFSLSRFMVGARMLGGYWSYSSTVKLKGQLVRAADGKVMGELKGEGNVADRDLGLSLLGRRPEKDRQFYGIGNLEFGSEEFRRTILGKALDEALAEIKAEVEKVLVPPKHTSRRALVVLVDGWTVYLNLGYEDGVEPGDRFGVYEEGEILRDPDTGEVLGRADPRKVGEIQVVVVKAPQLSKARLVRGKARKGPELRPE